MNEDQIQSLGVTVENGEIVPKDPAYKGNLYAPSYSVVSTKVKEWREQREKEGRPLTKTSLSLALGIDNDILFDIFHGKDCLEQPDAPEAYNKKAKKRQKIRPLVRRALMQCASYAEDELYKKTGQTQGIMYAMDNIFSKDWKSKATAEINNLYNIGNLYKLSVEREKELQNAEARENIQEISE